MKANRDDAPAYVRPSRRRSNTVTWAVASLMGSGVTIGLLYTLSSLYMQGKVDRLANKPKPAPVAEITRSAPAEKDWDKIVEDVAQRSNAAERELARKQQPQAPKKQTEYSTATYLPAHAVNVIPAAQQNKTQATTQQPRRPKEIVIVGKEPIKASDYCPGGEGSITRRNCKMHINLHNRN